MLRARNVSIRGPLRALDAQTVDPAFALTTSQGAELIVKYAGDTIDDGTYTGSLAQKPRQRLAIERRVLKHLAVSSSGGYALPRVVFFDKLTRTLALTRVGRGGCSLLTQLERIITDRRVAGQIGNFLAELHSLPLPKNPFWGTEQAERKNWAAIMRGCLHLIDGSSISSAMQRRWREYATSRARNDLRID